VATFYLDFENGNDSNDGTTFANRWKTITSGATAARTAPGDVIRIMKSPDPVSLGVNATFTKQSPTITLASAVTANIDTCETAWTASANVTASTSSTRKEGTLSSSFAIAAGFTTGLVAYRATGTLNLSAYNNISFWMRTSTATAANTFRIDLCSDTAGATPVHSFTIDTAFASTIWKPVTFKNGAALSSSIQSVAITALLDPGTNSVLIDNIIACNDLHFNALIGTSSSATSMIWYPIRSVNGTTVIIEREQNNVAGTNTSRGWSEDTTTATAYVRDTIRLTSQQTMNENGSTGNPIIYSGGWDRTNMSTQDGVTFVASDRNIMVSQTIHTASLTRLTIEKMAVLWGNVPFTAAGQYLKFLNCGHYAPNSALTVTSDAYVENYVAISTNSVGISATTAKLQSPISYGNDSIGIATAGHCIVNDAVSQNNNSVGFQNTGSCIAQDIVCRDNLTFGVSNSGGLELNGLTTSGNASNGVTNTGLLRLNNASISEATPFSNSNMMASIRASRYSTFTGYQFSNAGVVVDDVATPVHGTATRSYRHVPTTNTFSGIPFIQPLQPFAVNGSALVTFKIWVRRTNTNVAGRVRLKGWVTPGVDADVTATITAAANTWEELTVTCTPSAAGVVQIDLESYSVSGSSGTVYFGDATVTQA
jgi:hypothetical protein